jgi:hypothetical protein
MMQLLKEIEDEFLQRDREKEKSRTTELRMEALLTTFFWL